MLSATKGFKGKKPNHLSTKSAEWDPKVKYKFKGSFV